MPKSGPDKALCGAQLPNKPPGVTCHNVAGFRTEHLGVGCCYRHGGATGSHQRAAEVEIARLECDRLGIPITIDPGEALIQELWETAGNVAFYRELVQQLPTHPEPDEYHPPERGDDSGYWERGETGVYGRTYHVSGVPTGEAKPHILVTLYNDERQHLTAVASAALKAGVEERRVRIAEGYAEQIAAFARGLMIEFGIDPQSEKAQAAYRRQLTLAAGGTS